MSWGPCVGVLGRFFCSVEFGDFCLWVRYPVCRV